MKTKVIFFLLFSFLTINTTDVKAQSNTEQYVYKPVRVGVHLQYPGTIENYKNGLGYGVDLIFIDGNGNTSALVSASYTDSYEFNEGLSGLNVDSNLSMYTFRLGIALAPTFTPFMSVSKLESDIDLSSNQTSNLNLNIKDEARIGGGVMLRFPFPNNSAVTLKIEYNSSIEGFGGSIGFQI